MQLLQFFYAVFHFLYSFCFWISDSWTWETVSVLPYASSILPSPCLRCSLYVGYLVFSDDASVVTLESTSCILLFCSIISHISALCLWWTSSLDSSNACSAAISFSLDSNDFCCSAIFVSISAPSSLTSDLCVATSLVVTPTLHFLLQKSSFFQKPFSVHYFRLITITHSTLPIWGKKNGIKSFRLTLIYSVCTSENSTWHRRTYQ